ncbi:acyltransferase [Paenibacillus qinlingensis]|uniref:Peptidoglycan/LPS O-acetylase OafA/YrhL n=1 Tax=Paenibacillus qinlingensis TaxID=1837343 RepID=A0ABU1NPA4_9BACL|nr:acyltransferase [Paenibacillus qinlingensis]MDR6548852.1 peptidoglycan/LPS O-acetylase OafA/YrhL [Paenibacillus qinlingensis]
MISKPKLSEIDIVRAIAIIAVVLIHGTSGATQLPIGTGSQAIFFILNKASLFTVPLFIWISGLVLFYSYYDRWGSGMARIFWTKRLQKIVIPYLLWSIFYYLYNQFMFHGTIQLDAFHLFKLLLSGNASYHLYYMVIIVQFYVLFPLLMTAVKRYTWLRRALIPLGIGIQAASYTFHHRAFPLPEYSSLFLSYTATFFFGAFAGIYYPTIITWATRYKRWIWSAVLLAGGAFVGMLLLQQYEFAAFANTWFELALLAYCMTIPLVCVPWARKQLARGSRFSACLSALGAASFGIYLVHPAILTLWDRVAPEPALGRIWLYDLHTSAAVFIGLLGAWLLARAYASTMTKGSARR